MAQASCLAPLQRFSRALFKSCWLLLRYSGAVCTGAPSILARSVSGTMIHLSWVVSLQWPFHFYPTLAMVAGSCVLSGTPEALVCPPCGVTVQFSLRFSVFTFHPYLRFRCFGCCYAPSNSLQRSVCYVPILGTCLWCGLSSLTGL